MKSRDKFIKQVSSNIRRNHAKEENSSFIFGISGKWGEGKTTFLKDLQKDLNQNNEFRIIWISPWKYGNDKIALLRNFLKEIKPKSELPMFIKSILRELKIIIKKAYSSKDFRRGYFKNIKKLFDNYSFRRDINIWFKNLRSSVNDTEFEKTLLYDKNQASPHKGLIFLYILIILNIFLWAIVIQDQLPFMYPEVYKKMIGILLTFYNERATLINLLVVSFLAPTLFGIGKSLMSSQQSSKSVQTIDQFDRLLDSSLNEEMGRKIIVFVDDLDRVTPEIARDSLDNLRVFFNRSDLSFVVAGDHTVLERYIGQQTHAQGKPNEQIEEGRRYLKKIFNVYWRLPVPISSEFTQSLSDLLANNNRESSLRKIFKTNDEYNSFGLILERYFDRNFRGIERFVENVIFTFDVITSQLEDSENKNLDDLLKFPLLLTRVLLIQDFCAPLFEKIVNKIEILDQLELAAHKKERSSFDQTLKNCGDILTDNQINLLARIMFDSEGFYDSRGVFVVKSYNPFLYLATDSSLIDIRGPLIEEFITTLDSGDTDRIKNALIDSGDQKLTEAASNSVNHINKQVTDYLPFLTKSSALITALNSLSPDHRSQTIFIKSLVGLQISTVAPKITPQEERLKYYNLIWTWLNNIKDVDEIWLDKFPLVNNDDFKFIKLSENAVKYGTFTTKILGKWFKERYAAQPLDALTQINPHIIFLDANIFGQALVPLSDSIATDFVADGSLPSKEIRFKIIEHFLPQDRKTNAINSLYDKIDIQDEVITSWVIGLVNAGQTKLISLLNIEDRIYSLIDNCTSSAELIKLLTFARSKVSINKAKFWEKVTSEKLSLFLETLPTIQADENFRPFSLPEKQAIQVFKSIVIKSKDEPNVDIKSTLFDHLNKSKWMWESLARMPAGQNISGLQKSSDVRIKTKISEIKGSWGI